LQKYNFHQRYSTAYLHKDLEYIYKREAFTRIWQQHSEYNMLRGIDAVSRPEKVTGDEEKRNLNPSLTEAEKRPDYT
jgi:hypothetical protein